MKTTRRKLLALMGMGAAAAALPSGEAVAGEAAARECCNGACSGQDSSDGVSLLTRDSSDGVEFRVSGNTSFGSAWEPVTDLETARQRMAEINAWSIAQARADGYNRGREVEAARQEAKQDDTEFLRGMVAQARNTNTNVHLDKSEYLISGRSI